MSPMLTDRRTPDSDSGVPSYTRPATQSKPERAITACPNCGCNLETRGETVIKRGALTLTSNPTKVRWRGRIVRLSRTEAEIFRLIALRGRASFTAIDDAIRALGMRPENRSVNITRIRKKFEALGANDPFERVGRTGLRLRLEADENNEKATVIGLRA